MQALSSNKQQMFPVNTPLRDLCDSLCMQEIVTHALALRLTLCALFGAKAYHKFYMKNVHLVNGMARE